MGIYDEKVQCSLTNQQVNVSRKGRMAKCNRCDINDCKAKDYPTRFYDGQIIKYVKVR